jgi:four helix bundle protein
MRPFQDLVVWQKAHALTLHIYGVTRPYPSDERFGVTAQTRSSASSVPANICEGCGKRSLAQLRHHADIASGSLSELEYWLILARDLEYVTPEVFAASIEMLQEVRRLLIGFAGWSAADGETLDDLEGIKGRAGGPDGASSRRSEGQTTRGRVGPRRR